MIVTMVAAAGSAVIFLGGFGRAVIYFTLRFSLRFWRLGGEMDSAEVVLSGRATKRVMMGIIMSKMDKVLRRTRSTERVEFGSDRLVRGREGG